MVALSIDAERSDHPRAPRITMIDIFCRYEVSRRLVGHLNLDALVLDNEGFLTGRALLRGEVVAVLRPHTVVVLIRDKLVLFPNALAT